MDSKQIKKSYFHKGITAFLVIAASILFFFFIYRFDAVKSSIDKVISVLQPVIFGLVISYLLNPLVDILNNKIVMLMTKKKSLTKKGESFSKIMSVFISLLFFLLIIAGIFVLIIPGIIESVSDIVDILPGKIDKIIKWGNDFLKSNGTLKTTFEKILTYEKKWLKTDFANFVNSGAATFANGVMVVLGFLKNFAIGFMIAIYLLYNKKSFGNKSRKVMSAFLNKSLVDNILAALHKSNLVFSGFIYGKLLDSLIIGLICFIGITLLGIPYTLLISVIIAVTNVIPVFGPYIGAIPSALLIIAINPLKGLYFIIFIILLQTLDGNFIGPKILGDKTGLETFWVIFAIIVGGGMFGVLGMLVGVPIFAIVYYFISIAVNNELEKKNLSTDSSDYTSDKFLINDDFDGEVEKDA